MAVLDVKFERPITVFKPQDVLDIVDRYCGYDIADYLRDLFDRYESNDRELEAKTDSDFESYEAQVESNAAAFQDILAEVEGLNAELEQPRLNRDRLRNRLSTVSKILSNQI